MVERSRLGQGRMMCQDAAQKWSSWFETILALDLMVVWGSSSG